MAHLNNVKVVAATIEYNGATYVQSDEAAVVGDIIRIGRESVGFITDGAFYEVTQVDEDGESRFDDNDGDDCGIEFLDEEPTVFKRVEPMRAPQPADIITHEGRQYRKAARKANVGDLVISKIDTPSIFRVKYVDETGIKGGSTGGWRTYHKNYSVLEPIESAPTLPAKLPDDYVLHDGAVYRKEARTAKVGEVVVIINAHPYGGKYSEGDVLSVRSLFDSEGWAYLGDISYASAPEEYRVLVPAESITLNGAEFTMEKRKARVGESVLVVEEYLSGSMYANGDIVTVGRVNTDGDAYLNERSTIMSEYYVLVPKQVAAQPPQPKRLEVGEYARVVDQSGGFGGEIGSIVKILKDDGSDSIPLKCGDINGNELDAPWAAVSDLVRATDAEVAEASRALRFPVGAYVKVEKGAIGTISHHVGKIVVVEANGRPYQLRTIDGKTIGPAYDHEITQVSAEEAAEAKAQLERSKFAVGDSVKLTIPEGARPACGWGSVTNGEIGTISNISGDRVRVDFPSQKGWNGRLSEFTKLTPEEAAQEAERLKWAAIGREVGEYKAGDLVKVTQAHGAPLNVGQLTEVTSPRSNGSVNVTGGWAVSAELVTPVEQRFDLPKSA